MSQIYEIEKDLPPVYVAAPEPRRALESASFTENASSTRLLMEGFLANPESQRPTSNHLSGISTRSAEPRFKQFVIATVAILVLTLIGVFS